MSGAAKQFQTYAEYAECREQATVMYWQAFHDAGYKPADQAEIDKLDRRLETATLYHCWPQGGPDALKTLPGAPEGG